MPDLTPWQLAEEAARKLAEARPNLAVQVIGAQLDADSGGGSMTFWIRVWPAGDKPLTEMTERERHDAAATVERTRAAFKETKH